MLCTVNWIYQIIRCDQISHLNEWKQEYFFRKKVSPCVLEQYSKAKFSPRSCKNSFALSQENVSSIQEFSDTVCIFLNKYLLKCLHDYRTQGIVNTIPNIQRFANGLYLYTLNKDHLWQTFSVSLYFIG